MSIEAPSLVYAIQLAIAPAFLLTATGGLLGVMTVRLSRVIDRARAVEASLPQEVEKRDLAISELVTLDRRMVLINRAVSLSVASALTLCLLIATLFIVTLAPSELSADVVVPILFIIVMLLLIGGLANFLREIRISIHTVRVRAELVRGAPPPRGDISLSRHLPTLP